MTFHRFFERTTSIICYVVKMLAVLSIYMIPTVVLNMHLARNLKQQFLIPGQEQFIIR
jgi:hypothetical protein